MELPVEVSFWENRNVQISQMAPKKTIVNDEMALMLFALEKQLYPRQKRNDAITCWQKLKEKYVDIFTWTNCQDLNTISNFIHRIFVEDNFQVVPYFGRHSSLTETLSEKSGCCLGLTTLAICLGNEIGCEVRPLLYENHIAVTLAQKSDVSNLDADFPHIEPTRFGKLLSPKYRRIYYEEPVKHTPILNNDQFLAVHFASIAALNLAPSGHFRDALYFLEAAIDLYPEYLAAYINRAAILIQMKQWNHTMNALAYAIKLSP